jgi:hydrogenase maturation protease
VVGIGNLWRGDDAVGPEVASRVARLGILGVDVVVHDEPLALLEHLTDHDDVVVVDATRPAGSPGKVRVSQVGSGAARDDWPALGSHGLGVAEAVEIARALGRLPRRLTLIGVEASNVDLGEPLSAPVRDILDDAVGAVVDALTVRRPRARPRRSAGSCRSGACGPGSG